MSRHAVSLSGEMAVSQSLGAAARKGLDTLCCRRLSSRSKDRSEPGSSVESNVLCPMSFSVVSPARGVWPVEAARSWSCRLTLYGTR